MDQSRRPGCTCVDGASPICPADHRPVDPEWVRRARSGELAGFIVGGVPLDREDPELAALADYRRRHQAHPAYPGLDGDFDALADAVWAVEAPID